MKTSESIKSLAAALSSFKAGAFRKTSVNPHLKNKYANLDTLLGATRDELRSAGLVLLQSPTMVDGMPGLCSRLVHLESGEWVEDAFGFVAMDSVNKNAAQALGSYITYGRRYALSALLQLATEEDDDGSLTAQPVPKSAPKSGAPSWSAALAAAKSVEDINRVYKGASAGMDKESDEYAALVNACADRKQEVAG